MQEQSGWRINNIGGANIIIMKRPKVKDENSDYESYIYPVTSATWSQKKNLEAKKFQPTLRVNKPAVRNSERPIAKQVLQKKNRLRTVRSPSLSPPPSEDEKMEDSVIVKDNSSYGMRSSLLPDQDKKV